MCSRHIWAASLGVTGRRHHYISLALNWLRQECSSIGGNGPAQRCGISVESFFKTGVRGPKPRRYSGSEERGNYCGGPARGEIAP